LLQRVIITSFLSNIIAMINPMSNHPHSGTQGEIIPKITRNAPKINKITENMNIGIIRTPIINPIIDPIGP